MPSGDSAAGRGRGSVRGRQGPGFLTSKLLKLALMVLTLYRFKLLQFVAVFSSFSFINFT